MLEKCYRGAKAINLVNEVTVEVNVGVDEVWVVMPKPLIVSSSQELFCSGRYN
jgi:hypothetical protein